MFHLRLVSMAAQNGGGPLGPAAPASGAGVASGGRTQRCVRGAEVALGGDGPAAAGLNRGRDMETRV